MPTRDELLATGRSDEEICKEIGADALIYQDIEALVHAVQLSNASLENFDCSCFDGCYVTGDIDEAYLASIESARGDSYAIRRPANTSTQMDLNLVTAITEDEEEAA